MKKSVTVVKDRATSQCRLMSIMNLHIVQSHEASLLHCLYSTVLVNTLLHHLNAKIQVDKSHIYFQANYCRPILDVRTNMPIYESHNLHGPYKMYHMQHSTHGQVDSVKRCRLVSQNSNFHCWYQLISTDNVNSICHETSADSNHQQRNRQQKHA